MSFFGVTIETIESTRPIPERDKIECATLVGLGFEFVVLKDAYKPGDRVVYFPVDSILPEPVQVAMGLVGRLAGGTKNRVKTIKMGGQISQGVVGPLSILPPEFHSSGPEEITAHLGVTKYDPWSPQSGGPNQPREHIIPPWLGPYPAFLSIYDIESADREKWLVEAMMDVPVHVTEKVEGTNLAFVYDYESQAFSVCSRNYTVKDVPEARFIWHKWAQERNIPAILEDIARINKKSVALYGEGIGPNIQGNIYRLKAPTVLFFDLKIGNGWQTPNYFVRQEWPELGLIVPDLNPAARTLRGWLAGRTVKEASTGPSNVGCCPKLREGIVIRPRRDSDILTKPSFQGRLMIKMRSPEYLLKSDA